MRIIKFRYWEKPDASVNFEGKMHYDSDEYFNKWCGNPEYETMQFTGLLDRHGKEIYEGDIIQFKRNFEEFKRREVRWIGHYGEWSFPHLDDRESNDRKDITPKDILSSSWEIIGNIYENPELLK